MSVIGCLIPNGITLTVTGSGSYAGTQFSLNGAADAVNGMISDYGGVGFYGTNNQNGAGGYGTTTVPQGQWNAWTAQNNPTSNQNALMASGAIFVITP
jgi:hypothetical protein